MAMPGAEFTIYLGDGYFLDSSGVLSKGAPPPNKAVFKAPWKMPVNLDTVAKALSSVEKALPDGSDRSREKLGRIGLSDKGIKILVFVGQIAGVVAKVVPVLGAALVVAEWLGILKGGPDLDPLTELINQHYKDMETLYRAGEQQTRWSYIGDRMDVLGHAFDFVSKSNEEIRKYNPTPARMEALQQDMRGQFNDSAEAILNLLRFDTWYISYNASDYAGSWPWAAGKLRVFPDSAPTGTLASMVAPNTNRFDPRLAGPMSVAGLQMYLVILKAISPEYRTTGEFNQNLRDIAQRVEERVTDMRNQVLSRTVYDQYQLSGPYYAEQVRLAEIGGIPIPNLPPVGFSDAFAGYPVGAFDLCQYTDAFFNQPEVIAAAQAAGQPSKRGTFDTRWVPPGALIPEAQPWGQNETQYVYRLADPVKAADAANQQAEEDYADLLYGSGFFSLVNLSGLLRHLSTEPDESETVRGKLTTARHPLPDEPATARSEITYTAPIEAPATLTPVEIRIKAHLTTQPIIGRERQIPYRIMLRTLPVTSSFGLQDTPYGQFYWTKYIDAPQIVPGANQQLNINVLEGLQIDSKLLAEGTSPNDRVALEGDVELKVQTYDWYVPVQWYADSTPFIPIEAVQRWDLFEGPEGPGHIEALDRPVLSAADTRRISGREQVPVLHTLSGPNPYDTILHSMDEVDLKAQHLWGDMEKHFNGQRRHRQNATVRIHYKLEWKADSLIITLDGRPEDRNYLVYLVIEERLVSDQFLHTAFPAQMNGQLTFVPQEFFDRETEAIIKAAQAIKDVISVHYGNIGRPRPPDPVETFLRPGVFEDPVALGQLYGLLSEHRPELMREVIERLRGLQRRT
jgi:hypothetical protein